MGENECIKDVGEMPEDNQEDLGACERIILKCILEKEDGQV
jgi:hypothetical protein